MEISNSDEKFVPTVDWIAEKYFELNEWLFKGKLGNCLFEIYTTGKGMETTLGHFRFTGTNIKYDKRTRQMYYAGYGLKENINAIYGIIGIISKVSNVKVRVVDMLNIIYCSRFFLIY